MQVEVINSGKNNLPEYASAGSAGCDVKADFTNIDTSRIFNGKFYDAYDDNPAVLQLYPGGRALIPTGISIAIPEGYEVQVRARSGLALKNGVCLANGIGTVDADFRNEVGIIILNLGHEPFDIAQGDRIAQLVLNKVEQIEWVPVETLSGEDRGGGFGHSGK